MPSRTYLVAACTLLLAVTACQKSPPAGEAAVVEAPKEAAEEGVILKAEEVEKMGIETTLAAASSFIPEGTGYGLVVGHETVALGVAEVATAEAAARQSRAGIARVQRLAGTPGALPTESRETAERQSAADAAALLLAQQKLSVAVGSNPPWKQNTSQEILNSLASGKLKLIRVTFPLGVLAGKPRSLRFTALDANATARGWKTDRVWEAPADAAVPGRSFFALLNTNEVGEGERLQAWAPVGAAESGVLVPAAAVVISEGKYWCYLQRKPGTFERVEVDASKPVPEGYHVTAGVMPGDAIVTKAAGMLLARETNPSTEAE